MSMRSENDVRYEKTPLISEAEWDDRKLWEVVDAQGMDWTLDRLAEYCEQKIMDQPEKDGYWHRIKNELTYMRRKLFGMFAPTA